MELVEQLTTLHYELLTKEQERSLIEKAQNGCMKSRDELVEKNTMLIWKVVDNSGYGVSIGQEQRFDLFQSGVIGLLTAIDKFDLALGLRLSTYSMQWIRQSIGRPIHMGHYHRIFCSPVHNAKVAACLKRAKDSGVEITRDNCFDVYIKQCDLEGVTTRYGHRQALQSFDFLNSVNHSGDAIIENDSDDGKTTLFDTIESDGLSPELNVSTDNINEFILEKLQSLGVKDSWKKVILMRFGLGGYGREYTLEEVGHELGYTRERIRQIQIIMLDRLKDSFSLNKLTNISDVINIR